ncbi:hypothetical protein AKO1_000280, partial [Acrasis kona]
MDATSTEDRDTERPPCTDNVMDVDSQHSNFNNAEAPIAQLTYVAERIMSELCYLRDNKPLIDVEASCITITPMSVLEKPEPRVLDASKLSITVPETTEDESKEQVVVEEIYVKSEREREDELLQQEQNIRDQIAEMKQQNTWGNLSATEPRKSKKTVEPERNKTHWDFLLEEMEWLSKDFKGETRYKMTLAKKNARAVLRHHSTLATKEKKQKKDEEHQVRKLANRIAKIVKKDFWDKIEKIVQLRQQSKIDETKQKFMAEKRDYLVEQTEKFSEMLSQEMATPTKTVVKNLSSTFSQADDDMDDDHHVEQDADWMNRSINEDEQTEQQRISAASERAKEFMPTGYTLETSTVRTQVPFILSPNLKLREYQHIGLDWLRTMYDRGLNGILADEMGLGKTIQTISLLAHLATRSENPIWGPHLIVAPASVLLNWEIELKRWCPSFKVLSYHGTLKERKDKRKGWDKKDSFHVCITSYNLVVQDYKAFRRKQWHYMILDEAHHIKNFKSQCWQSLLHFNTKCRLLLTGTPLQNNVMELWSLMHFLMPSIFQSHSEFKEWFSNPVAGMVEGTQAVNEHLVSRLHSVLRPFLLRRLKKDVEKQLPEKIEKVIECKLSSRQRLLYEEFMSKTDTRAVLVSGNIFKIINVLMQLRKVCNHPDLFEPRPISSPLDVSCLNINAPGYLCDVIKNCNQVDLDFLGLKFILNEYFGKQESVTLDQLSKPSNKHHSPLIKELDEMESRSDSIRSKLVQGQQQIHNTIHDLKLPQPFHHHSVAANDRKLEHRRQQLLSLAYLNTFKCHRIVMCDGPRMEKIFNVPHKTQPIQQDVSLMELIKTNQQRLEETRFMENFMCIIPKAKCAPHELTQTHADPHHAHLQELESIQLQNTLSPLCDLYRSRFVRTQMHFPDKRLLQYDCGKLQVLDPLLRQLKQQGHRVLIFTQMSKMLNVLEQFLSMHNHTYFRLDGATKIEKRQYMMERFNADPKIFAFILSTRSGGLGINLTGADTVIFYDSDWNPAMDAQAQDRCHRIGQTKNVTIYRLISEKTIEERILLKANQKKQMNEIVIHSGGFTPDFLKKLDVRDLFGNDANHHDSNQHFHVNEEMENMSSKDVERMLMNAEDESDVMALKQAHQEQSEMDGIDFGEAGQSQSQS